MAAAGKWLDTRTLLITHTAAAVNMSVTIVDHAKAAAAAGGTNTTSTEPMQGSVRFRVTQTGRWVVALCNEEAAGGVATLAWAPLHVADCDSVPVVDPTVLEHTTHAPTPSFELPGTLAFDRQNTFELPHSVLPNQQHGTWSLTMWMWLWEHNGALQGIFYKGNGSHPRTPSAWIMSGDPVVTLRVTTETTADAGVGITTPKPLPVREWVHMAFVFSNTTASREAAKQGGRVVSDDASGIRSTKYDAARSQPVADGDASTYKACMYVTLWVATAFACADCAGAAWCACVWCSFINGERSLDLSYHQLVLPNDNRLQLGRGPWNPGMKGLASLVRMYPTALTATTVHSLFEQERGKFDVAAQAASGDGGDDSFGLRSVVAAAAVAARWAAWRAWFTDIVGSDRMRWQGAVDPAELTRDAMEILDKCDGDQVAALCVLPGCCGQLRSAPTYPCVCVEQSPAPPSCRRWRRRGDVPSCHGPSVPLTPPRV